MENKTHKVLALKYRPSSFFSVIGQDVMIETITNSIKLNKLPNAYLLNGIRGVGKTTTARLIAKALNCNKNFLKEENCNCNNCEEISNSKHLDVLEMDAASNTSIDDVRELIESSKYNPTSAKYKIYIIDECQMLSKQAWNGLLKTLEEPPPSIKFIFATTELKKIPVTIVSRCQRFDLHRVSIKALLENLKKISNLEGGKISEGALKLISKASEGSVRDSLSLLDRALVSQQIDEKEIDENFVREMLGIADRSKIFELIKFIFVGDQKKSLESLRAMMNQGVEPTAFLNDLLEAIYHIQQKKILGNLQSDLSISQFEIEIIDSISKDIKISTLILFWQFILKSLDELSIVSNPFLSLEMLLVRLIHLKEMPSYEKVLDSLKKDLSNIENTNIAPTKNTENLEKNIANKKNETIKLSKNQIKNITQTKPDLTSTKNEILIKEKETNVKSILNFEDLIYLSAEKKEVELKYDLEKNVNLIKFSDGKIDISFNDNLAKNFVKNLSQKLLEWTGKRWLITLTKAPGQKTFSEAQAIKKTELIEKGKNDGMYKKFKNIFSDAELIDISKKNKL